MSRLTKRLEDGNYVPVEMCGVNRLDEVDDLDSCSEYCSCQGNEDGCSSCAIQKCFNKLAQYENEEELGIGHPYITFKFSKEDIVDKKVKEIELDIKAIRNEAINDFVNAVKEKYPMDTNAIIHLEKIAEYLKESDNHEE